jgi:transaldolase
MSHKLKIFIDGPTHDEMLDLHNHDIAGFTFNPTLFKSLGVKDYFSYSKKIQSISDGLPISLEVIGDNYDDMVFQARTLSSLGSNVYVKIPITYTSGVSTIDVIRTLSEEGVNLNITALLSMNQVKKILPTIQNTNSIISVFAGRIYDIGFDAKIIMSDIASYIHKNSQCKLLWASPRMHFDAISAQNSGCDIITMTNSMYKKMSLIGKTPEQYSLETVQMFYDDAIASGFKL